MGVAKISLESREREEANGFGLGAWSGLRATLSGQLLLTTSGLRTLPPSFPGAGDHRERP